VILAGGGREHVVVVILGGRGLEPYNKCWRKEGEAELQSTKAFSSGILINL
jgi:hypothetical protein